MVVFDDVLTLEDCFINSIENNFDFRTVDFFVESKA